MITAQSNVGFFLYGGIGPQILVGTALLGVLAAAARSAVKVTVKVSKASDVVLGVGDTPDIGTRMGSVETRAAAIEEQIKPKNGEGTVREGLNRVEQVVLGAKADAEEAKFIAGAVAKSAEDERGRLRGEMNSLRIDLNTLIATGHVKEIAYVRALRSLGVDLTHVTEHLDDPPGT